jgi:hypothetical protein
MVLLKLFKLSVVVFAAYPVVGCHKPDAAVELPTSVTYTHWGCFGWCPAYNIDVDRSGHGTFEGRAYTAVHGKRAFSVTPRQYEAFVAALQPGFPIAKPFDPKKSLQDQIQADFVSWCPPDAPQHTDDTGVLVIWFGAQSKYLDNYFGCYPDRDRKLHMALDQAPNVLGLKNMIGVPSRQTPR